MDLRVVKNEVMKKVAAMSKLPTTDPTSLKLGTSNPGPIKKPQSSDNLKWLASKKV